MKNRIITLTAALFFITDSKACADYYPEGDFFNLFTQTIIKDKTYLPFLLVYGTQFYEDSEKRMIPHENIQAWQKHFGNALTYQETEYLVNHMSMNELNAYKRGSSSNQILSKLGPYSQHKEAIDYLIEAKYLEPFMLINHLDSEDSFYSTSDQNSKNATNLDYEKTVSALTSLFIAAKNRDIKQRYGYQLVRFNHYTRNYQAAIDAFERFVEPLGKNSVAYYYALDQMAGAQRGLKQNDDANWNFFQVFMKAPSRKESAFVSMKLSDSTSFNSLLQRVSTPEEKNMAYFLLGYSDFSNPLPNMEKMHEINPDSEILKVMAARSINQLERSYLPNYFFTDRDIREQEINSGVTKTAEPVAAPKKSFWDKIVDFFRNLFGKKEEKPATAQRTENADDKELLKSPYRIPVFQKQNLWWQEEPSPDYLADFSEFTEKTSQKSNDEFWSIADAYLKFLQKDYESSREILTSIKTTNPEYTAQINRLKMLNDITAQPKIDAEFEEQVMKNYPEIFAEEDPADNTEVKWDEKPSTADFVRDVFANRYFLQNEDGKSFLMNNKLSDLQYYPNADLAKALENFINKPQKNALEQTLMKNVDMKNPSAFLHVVFGDQAIRDGNFSKAKDHYAKSVNFEGIPRYDWIYEAEKTFKKPLIHADGAYNGFSNISSLVFGHNVWESFQSPEETSMKEEPSVSKFVFIKPLMNKYELADALLQLQQDGSADAIQLIGNMLYNTSSLGYFREVLMMDIDNSAWAKNDIFRNSPPQYQYYFKSYRWNPSIKNDNFDVAIKFYQQALSKSKDQEQKTRILFQMASAEQGKYYQWEAKQEHNLSYSDPRWETKHAEFNKKLDAEKNANYRRYFSQLKSGYSNTATAKSLMGSCSYFDHFMIR